MAFLVEACLRVIILLSRDLAALASHCLRLVISCSLFDQVTSEKADDRERGAMVVGPDSTTRFLADVCARLPLSLCAALKLTLRSGRLWRVTSFCSGAASEHFVLEAFRRLAFSAYSLHLAFEHVFCCERSSIKRDFCRAAYGAGVAHHFCDVRHFCSET